MAKVNVQKLTTPQKVAIVRLYTQYNKNSAETARQFSTMFPGFTVTRKHTIKVNRKFDKTGSVVDLLQSGRSRTGRSDENIATVQAIVDETPKSSSRNMTRLSGIKRGTILNILKKDLSLKSYNLTLCQGLHEDDYDRRLEFALTFLTTIENNPDIPKLTLWSDEARQISK